MDLSRISLTLAGAFLVASAALLATAPAQAAQIEQTEIDLTLDPNAESMTAEVRLHVTGNTGDQRLVCTFRRPTRMDYLREAVTGREVSYTFEALSSHQYGDERCTINLARLGRDCVLELAYTYSGSDFYAYGLNPGDMGNFVLGQITPESAFSSHLCYYPYTDGLTGQARISIMVPQGWTGVSAGVLEAKEPLGDQQRFTYEIPYASGMLPYPLAAAPYVVQEAVYEGRVLVGVYSSAADAGYAREKLEFLTTKLLPFLEGLMGDYPLTDLRIVETFPKEGNIGLATRGLVMLTDKTWFSGALGESYVSLPAIGLTDECAHQWNVYHVQFPNYLGEGLSQYTDELVLEHFADSHRMAKAMPYYRKAYTDIVDQLNQLKPFKDAGQSLEQAAQNLGRPVEAVAPYWPYAAWGELAISDPRVYPGLYFLRGALAMDALRSRMGDDLFFQGFKRLFSVHTCEPVTLDYCRQCFESVYGSSLEDFFRQWYCEPGLPNG
jgi:aminopeptidase N